MKLLVTLGLIQIMLVSYLLISDRNNSVSDQEDQGESLTKVSMAQISQRREHSNTASFDEDRLRQIIREELAQLMDQPVPSQEESRSKDRSESDDQYLLDQVELAIEQLKGIGEVSSQEILALEAKIVTLDEENRRRMLSKLATAMNSGEIDGRLQ